MGVSTSLQTTRYYDFFRDKEIIFTKANLRSLHIDPRQIYIKCNDGQYPCIINSTSLQMAKIIIGTTGAAYTFLTKNKATVVSLRYCFLDQNNAPIQFFVNCTVMDVQPYQNSKELAIVTLEFTQRPPDDLILHIGEFIEAQENFINRREERIEINENSMRKLGIQKEESVIYIEKVPRRCILKDLSFSGAKVMLVGVPKFLVNKAQALAINFTDTNEQCLLNGKIVRSEFLEGRKDIAICHLAFDDNEVPMTYKMHINNYITTLRKKALNSISNMQSQEQTDAGNANQAR